MFALLIALQMGDKIGQSGGCPPDFDAEFDPSELEWIQKHNKKETDNVFDNTGGIFVGMVNMVFCAVLPTVLTFPAEMSILVKVRRLRCMHVTTT